MADYRRSATLYTPIFVRRTLSEDGFPECVNTTAVKWDRHRGIMDAHQVCSKFQKSLFSNAGG